MFRAFLTAAAVFLLAAGAQAQVSGGISMTADRTQVRVGETFQLEIRADIQGGEPDEIQIPDLSDFIQIGKSVSRPIQFTFGFGNQRKTVQATTVYSYRLQAKQEGRVRLKPAVVKAGGLTFRSKRVEIVVGPGTNPSIPAPSEPENTTDAPAGVLSGANYDSTAFLRTVVDKKNPYIGEQVTVTVYLYARQLSADPNLVQEPSADGFWVHDLLTQQRTTGQQQNVNGVPFRVYTIRRFAAFPLRSGTLTIKPAKIVLQSGSIFDLFNGGSGNASSTEREGVAVDVEVRPLPEGTSTDAIVGKFSISTKVDRRSLKTGDAVTLTATVRGNGNIKDVRLDLPKLSGLRVLDPEMEDDVTHRKDIVGGRRVIKWIIVAEKPGSYTIPAMTLNSFDPATGTVTKVASNPIIINAIGAAIAEATPDTPVADQKATANEEPIAYGAFRSNSELERGERPVHQRRAFTFALAAPPLLFLLVFGFISARGRALNIASVRTPAVQIKEARGVLKDARNAIKQGSAGEFYAAVSKSLSIAVGSKIGRSATGLTHGELRDHLEDTGMPKDLTNRVVEELEACDFARFSSASGEPEEMNRCVQRVDGLLTNLEGWKPQDIAS